VVARTSREKDSEPMRHLPALAALLLAAAEIPAAEPVPLVALTDDGTLLRFSSADPATVTSVAVRGASGRLLGLDRRPADGQLYAVTDGNELYRVDADSGEAALASTLTAPFDGDQRSGVDFLPQADRLRLLSHDGQNVRVHVGLGAAAVDAGLAYAAADPHAGTKPAIAATAYTNNRPGVATTVMYDVDARLDVLVRQEPPNAGTLLTVGPLGADFLPETGFEIVTRDDGEHAFAVSGGALYTIDLATGRATRVGAVGDGTRRLVGLTEAPAP